MLIWLNGGAATRRPCHVLSGNSPGGNPPVGYTTPCWHIHHWHCRDMHLQDQNPRPSPCPYAALHHTDVPLFLGTPISANMHFFPSSTRTSLVYWLVSSTGPRCWYLLRHQGSETFFLCWHRASSASYGGWYKNGGFGVSFRQGLAAMGRNPALAVLFLGDLEVNTGLFSFVDVEG